MAEAAGRAQAVEKEEVVVKVGMVGDVQTGKTSLMVKFVEDVVQEDYIQTLGVNFMEKMVSIRNAHITFSIWDLGGQREFINVRRAISPKKLLSCLLCCRVVHKCAW